MTAVPEGSATATSAPPALGLRRVALVASLMMLAGSVGLWLWGVSLVNAFVVLTFRVDETPWTSVPGSRSAMVSGLVFAMGAIFACRQLAGLTPARYSAIGQCLVILSGVITLVASGFLLVGLFAQRASFMLMARAESAPRVEELMAATAWSANQLNVGWTLLIVASVSMLISTFLMDRSGPSPWQPAKFVAPFVLVGCAAALGSGIAWLLVWTRMRALDAMMSTTSQAINPADLASVLNGILMYGVMIAAALGAFGLVMVIGGIFCRSGQHAG